MAIAAPGARSRCRLGLGQHRLGGIERDRSGMQLGPRTDVGTGVAGELGLRRERVHGESQAGGDTVVDGLGECSRRGGDGDRTWVVAAVSDVDHRQRRAAGVGALADECLGRGEHDRLGPGTVAGSEQADRNRLRGRIRLDVSVSGHREAAGLDLRAVARVGASCAGGPRTRLQHVERHANRDGDGLGGRASIHVGCCGDRDGSVDVEDRGARRIPGPPRSRTDERLDGTPGLGLHTYHGASRKQTDAGRGALRDRLVLDAIARRASLQRQRARDQVHAVTDVHAGVAVDERVGAQHTELQSEAEAVAVGLCGGGHLGVDQQGHLSAADIDVGRDRRGIDRAVSSDERLDL